MANGLKYSITTETETLRKGNFWLAVGDVQKPFGTYYTAIVPPSGGYSIYQNKPSDGPAIYVANSDAELIQYTKLIMGTTFATGPSALNWYNSQTDKMVTNIEYPQISTNGLVLNLDAGFTPSFPKGGTTWYDLGASGNNGSLINGPTFSTATGGSIVFDGSDDYVALGNYSFGITRDFTISFWMDMTKTGSMQIFNKGYNSPWGIYIDKQSNNLLSCQLSYDSGSSAQIDSANNNNFSGIKNWTVVRNNTQLIWYLNGVQNSTAATTSDNISQSSLKTWAIGENLENIPGLANFQGSIFTQQVYNRALSRTEITQNYQAFLPRFLGQNIVTSGMVQYLNAGYTNSYPGSGTTWSNVAGVSGANGTLRNTPTYSSSNGGSIVFDGGDDYVEFLSSPTNVVTVSIWANLGTSGNFPLILAGNSLQYDSNLWNWSMYTYLGNFYIRGNAGSLGLISTPASTLVNKWMNWVLVRNDGTNTCRVYLNGSLFGTSNEVSSTDGTLSLGRGGNYLNGKVSNFQIYNRPLTASEVLQNYQASLPQILAENIVTSGMVAYYDAGYFTSYPGSGTSWYDVGGVLAATGTLTNGPTYSATGGGSISFDGSDDYILVNNGIYSLSGGTLTLWVMRTGSGLGVIGSYGGSGNQRSPTFYFDGVSSIGWEFGSLTARNTGVNFTLNQWFNLSLTYDSNFNVLVYVNGNQVGSGTSLNPGSFWNQFTIGRYGNYGNSYLNGLVSLVRIYNRALTPSEVLQNYNAQKSRFGL